MRFIGSNDKSTLDGVVEELQREHRTFELRRARLSSSARNMKEINSLNRLIEYTDYLIGMIEDAARNGPTPDLSKLRITIPEESRQALLAAKGRG